MTSGGGGGILIIGADGVTVGDLGIMNSGWMEDGSCIGACDGLRSAKPVERNESTFFNDTIP